jgi:glycosyltransferase involved in cell wall biosynthesis
MQLEALCCGLLRSATVAERRLRVLFVASHPVQYQAPLFRRLASRPELDIEVAYCSLRGAVPGLDAEFGVTIQWDVPLLEEYPWIRVPNSGSGTESFFGLRNPGLWKLIRAGEFDAVISLVGYVKATFWIACLAAKVSSTPFLFGTDATSLAPREGRSWKVVAKRIFWPFLFRLADQVLAPSSGTRDLLISLGLPSARVTLTPYTVDNEWWTRRATEVDRDKVRASWGASPASAIILFCAKLQPWKRPLDLLYAFAKANLSGSLLVFAGDGPLRGRLESEAIALGIAPVVRFLGFVNQSQLPAVYASADLMVLPSEYEPFAVVVNEAMCCGCPVAVSDRVGAARDLVTPLGSEFVFSLGDTHALAELLKNSFSDRPRLQSIGCAARSHIEKWSPEANILATMNALRAAVASQQPAGQKEGNS